jgi:hypothetical protein
LDTFADEIVEPCASRVFAISPFGYGHDPEADGAAAGLLELQAAITKPTATSRATTLKWARRLKLVLI